MFYKTSALQIIVYIFAGFFLLLGAFALLVGEDLSTLLPASSVAMLLFIWSHAQPKCKLLYSPFILRCYSDHMEILREQVYLSPKETCKICITLPYTSLQSVNYDLITNQLLFKGFVQATCCRQDGKQDTIQQKGMFAIYIEDLKLVDDLRFKIPTPVTYNHI